MFQIDLTFLGVLQYLPPTASPDVPPPPHRDPHQRLVSAIMGYCKDGDSLTLSSLPPSDLIALGAIIAFLLNAKIKSAQDLKSMTLDEQKKALIAANCTKTGIPGWRMQALGNAQLVQMGMLWFTGIDFSLNGLLSLFGIQRGQMTDTQAWDHVRQLLHEYSNEPQNNFQDTQFALLLGKLAVVAFLLRWKYNQSQLQQMSTVSQRQILVEENYWRTGIPYNLLNFQVTDPDIEYDDNNPVSPMQYKRCTPFSEKELVKIGLAWFVINKPHVTYNQVSWILTHDSFSGDSKRSGSDSSRDQDRNIEEQLGSGVRSVRISADGSGFVEHGGIAYFGTLSNYLGRIATFLANNPNEIVTIIDESTGTVNNWDTYTSQLGKYLFYPDINDPKHQFPPTWPTKDQIAAGIWPTIKDMVAYGYRAVVLHNSNYDTDYPWRLHSYDGSDNNFLISMDRDDYGIDEDYAYRPACTDVKNQNTQRYNSKTPNLYLINHYFYTQLLGHNTSKRSYCRYWGNTELIIEYAMLAWQSTGRKPNFFNVDFYDLPDVTNNFLFDLTNALNRPDAYGPFEIPDQINAGKPVQIVKSNYYQKIQIGKIYTISCMATVLSESGLYQANLARAGDTDGAAVSLAKADSNDSKQQWKVVYNTPQTGIALVTPDGNFALYDTGWNNPAQNIQSGQNNLILKTFQGNQEGTGFGLQGSNGTYVSIYKSNMAVGNNVSKIDPNNFNQQISAWQALGGVNNIDPNNLNVGRGALNSNEAQQWLFTPVEPNPPVPSHWTAYPQTIFASSNGILFHIPDEANPDNEEGWGKWDTPSLDQLKSFAKAIPQVTSFNVNEDPSATFGSNADAWLDSDPAGTTYVLHGYEET